MNNLLEVTVDMANPRMQYTSSLRNLPTIKMDYIPPFGDGDGYLPLELMLMSLATCSGSAVAAMLRKMGKTVADMHVTATGERRSEHPLSFHTITLNFTLSSPDASTIEMEKAIALSEESICPVWAMLKGNVTIKSSFSIHSTK